MDGPRTEFGHTEADTNVCLSSTHHVVLNPGEALRLGRREEREAQIGTRDRVRGHRLPYRARRDIASRYPEECDEHAVRAQ